MISSSIEGTVRTDQFFQYSVAGGQYVCLSDHSYFPMKNHLITLFTILSLTATALVCLAQSPSEADVTAIKKVITDETDGYFNRNKEQWVNAWAHVPYLQWSANSTDEPVLLTNGWEAYNQELGGNFDTAKPGMKAIVQRDNYQISVVANAATATFLQTLQLDTYSGKTREVRVLEKQGEACKLVYVNSRKVN